VVLKVAYETGGYAVTVCVEERPKLEQGAVTVGGGKMESEVRMAVLESAD